MGTPLGSMPSDLKEENRRAVLQAFCYSGALTVNDVAAKTGISRQTVKKYVEYYAEQRLLSYCGKGASSEVGGKRPALYSLNTDMRLVCISLHHQDLRLTLANLQSEPIAVWNSGTVHLESLAAMWRLVRAGRDALLGEEALAQVVGVGLSVPFATDEAGRLTVATPFPHWPAADFGQPLQQSLQPLFPGTRNILILSDGRAAGRAALQQYPDFQCTGTLATFYTSYGIGGSVIHDGALEQNVHNFIGAFGHITVSPGEEAQCTCGGHGCLEQMVNRRRLYQRLNGQPDAYRHSCLAGTPPEEVTFPQLFCGSAAGDTFCQAEARYFAGMFAVALRNIYLAAGPDLVVFQGDYGMADAVFDTELTERLCSFKYFACGKQPRIVYDRQDLAQRESEGLAYLLVEDTLARPEAYMA